MKVKSSLIEDASYSGKTKELTITFKNGSSKYIYSDVPPDEFNSLIKADSVGVYFSENIKGTYDFKKAE